LQAESVLVAGAFGAGKTTFVRTLSSKFLTSERELSGERVSFGERRLKQMTTVFADVGVVELDGRKLVLYGAPGQSRFDFTIRGLASRCKHLVLLVDTSDEAAVLRSRLYFERHLKPLYNRFERRVVALNKRDVSKLSVERVLQLFGSIEAPVVEAVATRRESCIHVLRVLLNQPLSRLDSYYR
jgi:signal recognition particle receptor subunit beta